jgi:hypothetical protein
MRDAKEGAAGRLGAAGTVGAAGMPGAAGTLGVTGRLGTARRLGAAFATGWAIVRVELAASAAPPVSTVPARRLTEVTLPRMIRRLCMTRSIGW